MDSKIILAILIVALIGIVAATYQTETSSIIETLSNVAVEEDSPEGATDILDSNIGSNSEGSIKVDEDVVKSDKSVPQKTVNKPTTTNKKVNTNSNNGRSNTNPSGNSNNTANPSNNNNNPSNNNNSMGLNNNTNSSVNQNNNTNSSTNQNTTPTYKISSARAKEIATNNLPAELSKAVASTPKLYNGYYEVTFYMNGKSVGYYEIDANTGAITGGAFENEVPNPELNNSVSN